MLESIRRVLAFPRVTFGQVAAVAVGSLFVWLLLQDQIPPLAIYLAQLFLMF